MNTTIQQSNHPGEMARERFRDKKPLMFSDWRRALFIHYEVDATALQRVIPFELDLYEGRAFVSLVAFSIRNLRPRMGGKVAEWLFRPIANHEFLNVRTYVRCGGRTGIYFMEEYLNNRLSVLLGPRSYGLPYRFGDIEYCHRPEEGNLEGSVSSGGQRLVYKTDLAEKPGLSFCESGTLDEFLLERYTAFTCHRGTKRFFDIWHPPWPQMSLPVIVTEDALIRNSLKAGLRTAELIGANYSPGVTDIWMGAPRKIN